MQIFGNWMNWRETFIGPFSVEIKSKLREDYKYIYNEKKKRKELEVEEEEEWKEIWTKENEKRRAKKKRRDNHFNGRVLPPKNWKSTESLRQKRSTP